MATEVLASSSVIRGPIGDQLIAPQNWALLVIDYQPAQVGAVRSMDRELLVKNSVSTVKLARLFGLPIVHSTVNAKSGRDKPTSHRSGSCSETIRRSIEPAPTATQPCSRHLVRDWWQRAEMRAGVPRVQGLGWHSLRRKFATELKHTPLKDLWYLGGWKEPQTVLRCYQRPDDVTMREALATRRTPTGWIGTCIDTINRHHRPNLGM